MTIAATAIERRSPDCQTVRQLAINFIDDFRAGTVPNFGIIEDLCRLAIDKGKPRQSQNATRVIFGGIIEPLCDDFSPKGVDVCNQVLVHILDIVRQHSQGGILDQLLGECGFQDSQDILRRYEKIINPHPLPPGHRRLIKKIIILSRVTAGADIAITSVMVHRLRKSFPLAEIVLIGPAHLAAMFPELDNIRARPFIYKNDGGLIDKMTSWPPLHKMIYEESRHDEPGSVLLFDPDTRMSQLGILPLLPDDSTCYFPSRLWQAKSGVHANLSILTNNWLNIILSESEAETPYLVLHNEGHGYNAFCQKLKARGSFIITINFGVGNDFRKKISGSFEEKLLFKLAQEPGNVLILDSGRGKVETQRVQYLLKKAKQQGINTATLDEEQITNADIKLNNGLIIFNGSLDALGKMISAADCFIGYDSCGQHLAAATGSPAAIIFAGAPSQRFIEHWAPISNKVETITTDSRQAATVTGRAELIAKIKHFISKLKNTTF